MTQGMNRTGASGFLSLARHHHVLDIRKKNEFNKAHIPRAINIPFPINLKALKNAFGLEGEVPHPEKFIDNFSGWKNEILCYIKEVPNLLVYCQSGGLRSLYFYQLLKEYRVSLIFLKGGYREYCNYQDSYFNDLEIPQLYVIYGKTGCGKTETIRSLRDSGQQVIAFADLAKHRGSAFGALPQLDQPTSSQFQHHLLAQCMSLDLTKPVFVEREAAHIGSVSIPESLLKIMEKAKIIQLEIPKSARVKYLLTQYTESDIPQLSKALRKIRGRLTTADCEKAMTHLRHRQLRKFAEIVVGYYDSTRNYQHNSKREIIKLNFQDVNPSKTAHQINTCINIE